MLEGIGAGEDKVVSYKLTNTASETTNKLEAASIAMLFHPKTRRATGFAQTQDGTTYEFWCKVDKAEKAVAF